MANTRKDPAPAVEPVHAPGALVVEAGQDAAPAPAVEPAQDAAPPVAEAAQDAAPAPAKPRPFLSEGMRQDLEQWGRATDPVTGAVFVLDADTGEVTVAEQPGV
jgi:hypothetical protein